MNNTIYILLIILGICMSLSIMTLCITRTISKVNSKTEPLYSLSELMEILNGTIERHFIYRTEYIYKLQNISVVGDYTKEVSELTRLTYNSLSDEIIHEFEHYYKEDELITIIFRAHALLITKFMCDKHKKKI